MKPMKKLDFSSRPSYNFKWSIYLFLSKLLISPLQALEKKTEAEKEKQTENSEIKTESDAAANDGDSAATETQNANANENAANDASVEATS